MNKNFLFRDPCKKCGCSSIECKYCEGFDFYRHKDDAKKEWANFQKIYYEKNRVRHNGFKRI